MSEQPKYKQGDKVILTVSGWYDDIPLLKGYVGTVHVLPTGTPDGVVFDESKSPIVMSYIEVKGRHSSIFEHVAPIESPDEDGDEENLCPLCSGTLMTKSANGVAQTMCVDCDFHIVHADEYQLTDDDDTQKVVITKDDDTHIPPFFLSDIPF